MIACDTVAPCENDSLDDAEVRPVVSRSWQKYNDPLAQIEETSVFTPIADGILPAFVVVYSIAIWLKQQIVCILEINSEWLLLRI